LPVVSGGLNERYSRGLLGNGTYFAEDIGKTDQYVVAAGDAMVELHQELYVKNGVRKPEGPLFYCFLCRVALGHALRTVDGQTDMDAGGQLWSSEKRELAMIPQMSPPEPYHSLVGELGGCLKRFREFVVFHGDRIYPEYLLAFKRIRNEAAPPAMPLAVATPKLPVPVLGLAPLLPGAPLPAAALVHGIDVSRLQPGVHIHVLSSAGVLKPAVVQLVQVDGSVT